MNPVDRVATQISFGSIDSPEQLEPDVDQDRLTASVMVDGTWGHDGHWESTVAWGQNRNRPGPTLNAFLLEAALEIDDRHTIFGRAEYAEKNELFLDPDPRADRVFDVGSVTLGYRYDVLRGQNTVFGIGGAGALALVPDELHGDYSDAPVSGMLFLHGAIR